MRTSSARPAFWQHNFASYTEARAAISCLIFWYDEGRPHHALGYLSLHQDSRIGLKNHTRDVIRAPIGASAAWYRLGRRMEAAYTDHESPQRVPPRRRWGWGRHATHAALEPDEARPR